jgi:hypothetical protein
MSSWLTTRKCAHFRCKNDAVQMTLHDDHDSNGGEYEVNDFCSLECFALQLIHHVENDDRNAFVDAVNRVLGVSR